ncbi:hypothetical protein GF354_01240, partial [Candidatus Peregrinibacteria bacterium]|nr:hypothetical protein [Candidatus Peregrinibacteria bacterium]
MNSNTNKNLEEVKKSAWSFFIRRRPIAYLLILAIVIFGVLSAYSMPKELQPEIVIPFGTVSTILPGASPSDIESLVTIPLEKQIATVNDIKSLSSSSNFNSSLIFIEFETGADLDSAIQDVKEAVDQAVPDLPEDASDPMVVKAEANSFSIISFTFASDKPLNEVTDIAQKAADELETLNGVSRVDLFGGQEKIIKVTLNQKLVEAYGLDINTIANLIKYGNSSSPIGLIDIDKLNYSVRIDNQYQNINDIKKLPLFSIENTPILLEDIAKVEETYNEKSTISRFSFMGSEPQESLSISVNKKDGANILDVADESRKKIEELKEDGIIPSDITVEVSNDNSVFIRKDLGVLTTNGIQTTIIITIVLFLALGLKEGLLAGLAIPLSFLIAFSVMNFLGLTINSLSLFSLV